MARIKTTPKVENAEVDAPAVPLATMVEAFAPIVNKIAGSLKEADAALFRAGEFKAELVVKGIEFADQGADRAEMKAGYAAAISKIYGVPESKVTSPKKNGGDATCYTLMSEMLTITFVKDENKKKVAKGLEDKRSWAQIKSLARNGLLKAKAKVPKAPEPMGLDKFVVALSSVLLKLKQDNPQSFSSSEDEDSDAWTAISETYDSVANGEQAEGGDAEAEGGDEAGED